MQLWRSSTTGHLCIVEQWDHSTADKQHVSDRLSISYLKEDGKREQKQDVHQYLTRRA
jgi:hypothetical protein